MINIPVSILKIPSVEITNYFFLEKFAKTKLPIILSTGTAEIEDIDKALEILKKNNNRIILLQCTSAYPSKFNEIDLNVIQTFKDKYNCLVGFSGHEPGINVAVSAVALGAKVIEKHVTLNKNMNGTDHLASIDMQELKLMVDGIRQIEKAVGSKNKKKYNSENVLVSILGKSLVLKNSLKAGDEIKKENLTSKGPATGINAKLYYKVIGKKLIKDKKADELLLPEDIKL